jgi:hypothetical protein
VDLFGDGYSVLDHTFVYVLHFMLLNCRIAYEVGYVF